METTLNEKLNNSLKEELREKILSKERIMNELVGEILDLNITLSSLEEKSDKSCFGNCLPPILPTPAKDVVLAGLESAIKLIENVKSASYTKGEGEIKIEIVIEVPKPPIGGTI